MPFGSVQGGYEGPGFKRRKKHRRRHRKPPRPRGLNTIRGAEGKGRSRQPIGPPAPGLTRPGPFKRPAQVRRAKPPGGSRRYRRALRVAHRREAARSTIQFLHQARPPVSSGGIRIGPVHVPAPVVDFAKGGGGVPGLVIRHLGPVAEGAADTGSDVAKELFDKLEQAYGGGGKKIDVADLKGPPAPGKDRPGPFYRGVPGLTGTGAVPTVTGTSYIGRTPRAIGLAFGSDPTGVGGKTIKGFYEMGTGFVGMLGEATKDPSVLLRIPQQMWDDFDRRYGGDEQAMIRRLKKEGVAPEIAEAVSALAVGGGLAGRVATGLARAGKLGRRAEEFVKSERPGLQVTGGKVRPQERHPNLFRAVGEARRDVRRQRRTATRMSRAHRHRDAVRGLVPGGRTVKVRPSRAEMFMAGEGRQAFRIRPQSKRLQDVSRDIVAPRTLFAQHRLERREAARVASLAHEAHRMDRHEQINKGFRRELASLNRKARNAVFHVAQGIIDPTDRAKAVAGLRARRERLIAEGATPGPRMMSKTNNEVRLIDYLIRNSKDIFGGESGAKLAKFREDAHARSLALEELEARRVGTYGLATAEARRLRAQAEGAGLDVVYPAKEIEELDNIIRAAEDPADSAQLDLAPGERAATKAQTIQEAKQAQERILRGYSAQVRAAREADELTPSVEPAFITHEKSNQFGSASYATGGARAVQGPKRSRMELLRVGRANTHPQALEESIARSLKRVHNWEVVARQAEVSTVNVSPAELGKAGLLRDVTGPDGEVIAQVPKHADELTIDEWRTFLRTKGMDYRDWAFWSPGRMRLRHEKVRSIEKMDADEIRAEGDEALSDAGSSKQFDEAIKSTLHAADVEPEGAIAKAKGWRLIPRAAYEEIMDSTHPSRAFGRGIGKVQGLQSRIMLGLSPSWLQMQVAANALLAAGATKLNVAGFLRSPIFWHGFKEAEPSLMRRIDEELGSSVMQAHGQKIKWGASLDQKPGVDAMVSMIDGFTELPVLKQIKHGGIVAGKRIPSPNPIDGMFFLDQAQNRYFRHLVLYNNVKREAFKQMGRDMGQAAKVQAQLAHLLRGKHPAEQMKAILENPALLEKHVRLVEDWLGNYTTFTAAERRYLKRAVLFYGFLRHSTRLLFWTLPVKHPAMVAIAAKLTQLRNEEVRDLLGGDAVPWAFSRVYIDARTGHVATRETPDSAVRSVDLYRLNPVTNALVEAVEDPKKAAGLMSPAIQSIFDQIYSTKAFSGQGFQIEGSAKYVQDLPFYSPQRAQIALGSLLSTAYPYRKAMQIRAGGRSQSDDALLWHMEPMHYKGAEERARERRRIKNYRRTSPLADLAPLLGLADARFAKPDTTRQDVRRRKKGGSSSGGGSFPKPGGSSSGGFPKPGGGY